MTHTPQSQAVPAASTNAKLVDAVKTAGALIEEHAAALNAANTKLSRYEADDQASQEPIQSLVKKLSSTRIDGDFLIPPEQAQKYLNGLTEKHNMASVANELADILIRKEAGANKVANDLGEPGDISERSTPARGSGFASLPSTISL